jgi:hypothetical protein
MKGFATKEKQNYRKQLGWVQEGICNYRKTKLWNTIRLSKMKGFATLEKQIYRKQLGWVQEGICKL